MEDRYRNVVVAVQQKLHAAAYYSGKIDGRMHAETAAAIAKYEASHSLRVTGRITPGLLRKLGLNLGQLVQFSGLKPLKGNTRRFKRIVMEAQLALYALGYYSGSISGSVTERMRESLRQYQRTYGLAVTGTLTPEVLDALRVVAK